MGALDYDLEQQRIARNRKIAEALLAQSAQPLGGTETVGGIAVRRSPLEGIAKVAQAYAGQSNMKRADDEARALGDKQRGDVAAAIEEYQRATSGRPAGYEHIVDEQANDGEGASATIETPGYTPGANDRRAAAMTLAGKVGGDPTQTAKMMVAQALSGAGQFAKVDPKDYTPESIAAYKASGDESVLRPRVKSEFVHGRAVDPYATQPGTVIPQQVGPSDVSRLIAERDALPQGDPRRATLDDAIKKATTHQPATSVNVSTGKKYGEAFATKIADDDVNVRNAAMKAPELAERANRVIQTLASGKVLTGTGADIRLQIGKALNLAGASDAETVANTETLMTDIAKNTLDAIKASGLGAGSGFSNADRDFLEKAVGGKISLEAATLKRLAELSHRAASKSAEAWSKRVKDIPEEALRGAGIKRDAITVPAMFGGQPAGPNIDPAVLEFLKANNIALPGAPAQ